MLSVKALSKNYSHFSMEGVSFDIPDGAVVGLIGENGAGKSTIIKCILGIVRPDGGEVLFSGKPVNCLTKAEKQKIAYVLDDGGLPAELNITMLNKVLSNVFECWDSSKFKELTARFGLPEKKKIKQFSRGMKVKAAIAVALSYASDILILDEPTSGLDPVVRDEILGMIYDYNCRENRAALISSHIMSDLEKICDYIVYIHKGKMLINEQKDVLLEKYAVYTVDGAKLGELDKGAIVKVLRREYGVDVLALKERMPADFEFRPAGLEDIMLFYSKGEDLC